MKTSLHRSALAAVAVLLVVVSLLSGSAPVVAQGEGNQQLDNGDSATRTITVQSTGQVSVRPETATVTLGVEAQAEQAAQALAQANEAMQSVLDALRGAGVQEQDIQTELLQLIPLFEQPTSTQDQAGQTEEPLQLVGFLATNLVRVQGQDVDGLGSLLDRAVQAGANQVLGIRFEVADTPNVLEQAREAAWNDAVQKAEALAETAGAQLGRVLTIRQTSATPFPLLEAQAVGSDAQAVPIVPGAQTVTVELQVTWLLDGGETGEAGSQGQVDGGSGDAVSRVAVYLVALGDEGQSGELFGCGDSLVPVEMDVTPTKAPLTTALRTLIGLKQRTYGESGLNNVFYNSDLALESITAHDSTATIRLTGTAQLGGVCDDPRFTGQIRATAMQYLMVDRVEILVNGEPFPVSTQSQLPEGTRPPEAARRAQRSLAERLGLRAAQVQIVEALRGRWPNACLGLPRERERCAEAVTPGWQVVLDAQGQRYEAHTNWHGLNIRWVNRQVDPQQTTGFPPEAAFVARRALARRLNLKIIQVWIFATQQVDWPNACLDLPREGETCAEVVTPGYRVLLEAKGQRYEAHTDRLGEQVRWVE